jgi:hypothetical protein
VSGVDVAERAGARVELRVEEGDVAGGAGRTAEQAVEGRDQLGQFTFV